MPEQTPLHLPPRYQRSIHLQRDFADSQLGIVGYQVTPLVVQTSEQILAGLAPGATARAFSIIGPYGAGKSAYALFLAHLLRGNPPTRRKLLASFATDPLVAGPSLLPVLVSGNNASLRVAILRALQRTLAAEAALKTPRLLDAISAALTAPDLDPQQVADLLAAAGALVAEKMSFTGIALLIDELGQFLDFAARQGDQRDVFVLQTLAEAAARSGETPLLLVTILHQSFDRYAAHAGATRRSEWAKVQGRFADLPFQEPPAQMLRMVGAALAPQGGDVFAAQRQQWAAQIAPETDALDLRPADLGYAEWQQIIARAYPLHPLVLVALPQLFRQLAQNERSLFAFLTSREPWSVQDVLASAPAGEMPIYRLPQLYNYIQATLGPSLFSRARGQRWAELAEARAQIAASDRVTVDVLTVIGTLGALGQVRGLKADRQQILFALCGDATHAGYSEADIERALHELTVRKHISYRQHRNSFVIWEGSDLDIDGLTQTARRELMDRTALVDLLREHAAPTPMVARRHSYRTGAVRIFNVRFVEATDLKNLAAVNSEADGEILYVVPGDEEALGMAYAWAIAPERESETRQIVVLPQQVQELRDLLLDVAAIQYVLINTQELEGDRPARRELSSRLIEAQQVLTQTITENYGPGLGQWFWRGSGMNVRSARQIDELLSNAADATYPLAPRIWNELIVRRQPSAAATKARRNLIEGMLEHPQRELLDIEGFPPERAMYASILVGSGIHRQNERGAWYFGSPSANDPLHLVPVWNAIHNFLASSESAERPIAELFALLETAPYGVKSGVVPILFMAVYAANLGEIALYEYGSYVPMPDTAMFERLLRQPNNFAIRSSRISGTRSAVYERVARALVPRVLEQTAHPAVLDVVTPLLRLVRGLPEYSRNTRNISPRAQAIRKALLETRAPDELLFTDLALACGMLPFSPDLPIDESLLDSFFAELRNGLEEVQGAYAQLVQAVRTAIRAAFGAVALETSALHQELLQRYQQIASTAGDVQLRSLGVRLENAGAGEAWVESIGALIGRKSLGTWNDDDLNSFRLHINDWGRRFRTVEQIAVASQRIAADAPVMRVGIANGHGEHSAVVSSHYHSDAMEQLRRDLEATLAKYATLTTEQRTTVLASLLEPLLVGDTGRNGHI